MMTEKQDEHIWEKGWDGHELEQLRRLAQLTFAAKLRWLEEAARLVRQLAESPRVSQRPDQKK